MKRFYVFGATLLALAACQKTGTEAITPAGSTLKVEPVITRATEVNFESGDNIGLTVIKTNDTEDYATNAKLSFADGAFAGDITWYEDVYSTSGLYAYYPYAEEMPSTVSVGSDQTGGIAQYDFMTAVKEGVLPVLSPVTMVFKHALTKIVVNVDNQTSAKIVKVTLQNTVPSGYYDFRTGTVTVADAEAEEISAAEVGEGKYAAIVIPQTAAMKVAVTFNNAKIVSQPLASMAMAMGGQYTVDVRVTEDNMSVKATGEIQNWTDEGNIPLAGDSDVEDKPVTFEEFDGYFVYDDVRYNTITLSNGQTWMAEPLRFIPRGMMPSSDPADGSGLWYPYTLTVTFDDEENPTKATNVANAATDDETVAEKGYLYSANVYLGNVTYGEDNFTSFEGVQGICPDGWHIPTKSEFVALFGFAQSGSGVVAVTDTEAPLYDASYEGGLVPKAIELGWDPVFSGSVISGKYNTSAITQLNSTASSLFNQPSLTYFAGSTGYSKTQVWAGMTTFTLAKYPNGRMHTAFSSVTNGVQVRCIKNAE
ncbi:MAG: fimbrillin family protein [Candidatus Cryptobacteroides sp.]